MPVPLYNLLSWAVHETALAPLVQGESDIPIQVLRANDMYGENALLSSEHRTTNIVAKADRVVALSLKREAVE